MTTNMAFLATDHRGPVTLDQLKSDTKRMILGIELECTAIYPMELFEGDTRNAQGDVISALSLACMDRSIKSTNHESLDDDDEVLNIDTPSYSKWNFKDEGGLHLSKQEREALPADLIDHMIQPPELSSRHFSFEKDDY